MARRKLDRINQVGDLDDLRGPPGKMLSEELLKPLGMTWGKLAEKIPVPLRPGERAGQGKRRVTPSTALRLSGAFGTGPDFWLNGQMALDLYRTIDGEDEIAEANRIEPVPR